MTCNFTASPHAPYPCRFQRKAERAAVTSETSLSGVRAGVESGMTAASDCRAMIFVKNACEYYATARFAMHAQCMPVCRNLFHHAVEMLLKRGLARKRG